VPRAEFACGRVGDDGDVIAAQLVRPALRLLSGRAACMAANYCICMMWRFVPPYASVVVLMSYVWAHTLVGTGLVVRGEVLSCEAETCRVRRRLVMGVPLVGNWSEMQPTGRRLDVLLVWILTRVPSHPCPESLP
jgi:hypothetical protein